MKNLSIKTLIPKSDYWKNSLRSYGTQEALSHDPAKRVSLLAYSFNGGAPELTAPYTAKGPKALWDSFSPTLLSENNIAFWQSKFNNKRNNNLSENGVRNYHNVRNALETQFIATAATILRGEKPIGIGGDHSMAAGSIRGAVLAVTMQGILDAHNPAKLEHEKDVSLQFTSKGSDTEKQILSDIQKAIAQGDVLRLGKILDYVIEEGLLPLENYQRFKNRIYIPWADAHYDINTPVNSTDLQARTTQIAHSKQGIFTEIHSPSPSGNFHGMPVATLAGSGPREMVEFGSKYLSINPANVGFFGVRDGDPNEEIVVQQLGCFNYRMDDIRKIGLPRVIDDFEARIAKRCLHETGQEPIKYGQLDIDFLNAPYVPLTGTPVGDGSERNIAPGPSLQEAVESFRGMMNDQGYVGLDITELASCRKTDPEDRTINAGRELLLSVLNLDKSLATRSVEHVRKSRESTSNSR